MKVRATKLSALLTSLVIVSACSKGGSNGKSARPVNSPVEISQDTEDTVEEIVNEEIEEAYIEEAPLESEPERNEEIVNVSPAESIRADFCAPRVQEILSEFQIDRNAIKKMKDYIGSRGDLVEEMTKTSRRSIKNKINQLKFKANRPAIRRKREQLATMLAADVRPNNVLVTTLLDEIKNDLEIQGSNGLTEISEVNANRISRRYVRDNSSRHQNMVLKTDEFKGSIQQLESLFGAQNVATQFDLQRRTARRKDMNQFRLDSRTNRYYINVFEWGGRYHDQSQEVTNYNFFDLQIDNNSAASGLLGKEDTIILCERNYMAYKFSALRSTFVSSESPVVHAIDDNDRNNVYTWSCAGISLSSLETIDLEDQKKSLNGSIVSYLNSKFDLSLFINHHTSAPSQNEFHEIYGYYSNVSYEDYARRFQRATYFDRVDVDTPFNSVYLRDQVQKDELLVQRATHYLERTALSLRQRIHAVARGQCSIYDAVEIERELSVSPESFYILERQTNPGVFVNSSGLSVR